MFILFAEVHVGESLMYVNSLDNLAIAINRGSFSRAFQAEHLLPYGM